MNNLIPEYNSTELLGGIRLILYEKKIVYLSVYQDGDKMASAGFVKLSREKDACLLDIHIKCSAGIRDGKHALYLAARSRKIDWGTITIQDGKGAVEKRIWMDKGVARFGEEEFEENDLCGISIHLEGQRWIAGYWEEVKKFSSPAAISDLIAADETGVHKKTEESKKPEEPMEKRGIFLPESAAEDKWEQLLRCYKKIHPFGDGRVFLSVEPKDFIILQAPYQRLVNNSFLLHGFYNYRHMILGPDKEIGNNDGSCFYLGVPGTYFEREKMVAIMFGFEGFECDGAVEVGKFGYYMRRVEI